MPWHKLILKLMIKNFSYQFLQQELNGSKQLQKVSKVAWLIIWTHSQTALSRISLTRADPEGGRWGGLLVSCESWNRNRLLEGMPPPRWSLNSKELQPIAICAVGELNTGEQESRGMTENLVNVWVAIYWYQYSLWLSCVLGQLVNVRVPFWRWSKLKNSVSRALQRSSVFLQLSTLCVGGETSSSHFLPPRVIGSPKHAPSSCTSPPFLKILDPPLSISTWNFVILT